MQNSPFHADPEREATLHRLLDEMAQRERKLAFALEGSRDGFWDWDVATGAVDHSPRWCEMLGFAPGDVAPHISSWESLVHPDDLGDAQAMLQAHLNGSAETYRSEYRMRTRDGRVIWVLDRGRVSERDGAGRAIRVSGTQTDITQSKQIELALRRRDAILEAVSISAELLLGSTSWEEVTDEVLGWLGAATGADRVYLFAVEKDAAGESWARPRFEWLAEGIATGMNDPLLQSLPLVRGGLARWVGELTEGRPIRGAVRDLPPAEQPLPRSAGVLSLAIVPVRIDDALWGFVGFDACREERDWSVAELDALRAAASTLSAAIRRGQTEAALHAREEGLRRAHRTEAVARLAAGVAHEFNNMLMVIQGHADVLESQIGVDAEALESLHAIRSAADRSAELTRQLLAYGRRNGGRPAALDLNDVIRNAHRVLAPALGSRVELITRLEAALPPVLAETTQLEQLLLDLATNARAAMPAGGELRIETGVLPDGGSHGSGARVLLRVADTGCGMDAHTLERIFEPFFTTRPAGEALGLGLTTVYGIVQQCGGTIDVSSGVNAGTTFTITLPAAAPQEPAAPASAPSGDVASGTVLVVEDDAAVRGLTRRLVERLGYRTLVASSAEEALAVLAEQPPATVGLVLTDVLMAGMTGLELANRLRERHPALPVLLMSGYSEEALEEVSGAAARLPVLLKPFTPAALAARVRETLHGGG